MSDHERRQHRRYPLRMDLKLRRGSEELDVQVINASAGGCLILAQVHLMVGDKVEACLPQLRLPTARLHVLRSQQFDKGWMVAACFEAALADEQALANLSRQFQLAVPEQAQRVLH
jgi:hypothetical protein